MAEKVIVILLVCLAGILVGIMFYILLMLTRVVKTLRNNGESLSKIAKHFEQMDKENENNKHSSGSLT